MSITIDGAGRLVVPKRIRDAAGLRPGTELDIRLRGGCIELEPRAVQVSIRTVGGVAVAVPSEPVDTLTVEAVAGVLDADRDERG